MQTFKFVAVTRTGTVYSGDVKAPSAEQGAQQAADHMKAKGIGRCRSVVIDGSTYFPRS